MLDVRDQDDGRVQNNADSILACSLCGEVYVSEDAGDAWRQIAGAFGAIRIVAWRRH